MFLSTVVDRLVDRAGGSGMGFSSCWDRNFRDV